MGIATPVSVTPLRGLLGPTLCNSVKDDAEQHDGDTRGETLAGELRLGLAHDDEISQATRTDESTDDDDGQHEDESLIDAEKN